jgi:hypothetical protein
MFDTVAMLRAARRILMFPHVEVGLSDTVARYLLKILTDLDGTEGHTVTSMRLVKMSSSIEDYVPIRTIVLLDVVWKERLREILVVERLVGLFLDIWSRGVHDLASMRR